MTPNMNPRDYVGESHSVNIRSTFTLECGNDACYALAERTWPAMRRKFATWEEMAALECDICKSKRQLRCRVQHDTGKDKRHSEPPFTEAPFIVPYNLPKYFAQQLRAVEFAKAAKPAKPLYWIVARDRPLLGDIKRLTGTELARREAQWLQKHDQQTNGIMGFMPCVPGMPVRFTATADKERKIFKNTRGVLLKYQFDPLDVSLLQGQQPQEVILKHTPAFLFVQIPGATWIVHEALGPGVYPLKPVFRRWHLDKAKKNHIGRWGFQLVPDFSGTSHSYAGTP